MSLVPYVLESTSRGERTYDILIEKFFDFLRLQQVDSAEIRSFFLIGKFLFQNLRAEFDTVIADIYIICASDQFSNLILCLAAK